jgi:hypothetical protein
MTAVAGIRIVAGILISFLAKSVIPKEAPRGVSPYGVLWRRLRNLLSGSWWPVAAPWTRRCPAVGVAAAMVRAAATGLTQTDGRFLGPATGGVEAGSARPGLGMTVVPG